VRIADDAQQRIRDACVRGYPEEVCGVLVGHDRDGSRSVEHVVPVDNARDENRARRYLITADTLARIERDAIAGGSEVVGFYHSHPEHPAIPSAYDHEHSWPWYTYVIVAVHSGAVTDMKAWQLADDRSRFDEREIVPQYETQNG
jgi:proteasome lid subunit RPN8/RPN11